MQALLIYVLIRLDEGATDYNNFDNLLLKAVTVSQTPAFSTALSLKWNIGNSSAVQRL